MSLRQVQLTDLQISACSLWVSPSGARFLPVPFTLPFYFDADGNGTQTTPYLDVELGTPPEFHFLVKVVSATMLIPGTLVQIQWPDGRYLSNPGIDVYSFYRTGKNGRLIDPHKLLAPDQKIRFNIDNTANSAGTQVQIYFEGCLLVPMAGA